MNGCGVSTSTRATSVLSHSEIGKRQALDRHRLMQRAEPRSGEGRANGPPRIDQTFLRPRRDELMRRAAWLKARHVAAGEHL